MQIPRILVLGATGRIGATLRRCWPTGPMQGQILWQSRRAWSGQGESWVVLDPLRQPEALARAAGGCSAILCLAGIVPGQGQEKGRRLGDNIALAGAAVRAGAATGAAVFLTSSAAVYGNQPGVLEESALLRPVSEYGKAKAAMEARARVLAAELGVRVCALRIGNIAGIDATLGDWRPGFRLDRFADGRTPRRSYIGMQTLARVLGDLMQADDLPDVLNVAAPGTLEMGALLEAAGLAWEARVAPENAIEELCLSTRALARFTTLKGVNADTLVAEWRAMKDST